MTAIRYARPLSGAELVDLEARAHAGVLTADEQWRLMEEVQRLRAMPGGQRDALTPEAVKDIRSRLEDALDSLRDAEHRVETALDDLPNERRSR